MQHPGQDGPGISLPLSGRTSVVAQDFQIYGVAVVWTWGQSYWVLYENMTTWAVLSTGGIRLDLIHIPTHPVTGGSNLRLLMPLMARLGYCFIRAARQLRDAFDWVVSVEGQSHSDASKAARTSLTAMISSEPDRLRRRSISLGVSPNDAEDVAQTALLRAWRSIEHLKSPEPGQMCSWLDRIARNAAIDLARQQGRRPQEPLSDAMADAANVSGETEIRLFLDGALQAIRSLPVTLREPLLLSVVDELTAPEIAERLNISSPAVRQRITRARQALAKCRESDFELD